MRFKDNIKSAWFVIEKHFLMPFCISLSVVFFTASIFGLKFNLLSSSLVLYAGLVFGFLAFFLWFKKLGKTSQIRAIILKFFSPLFLMSLLIITIPQLDFITTKFDLHLIKDANPILIVISIFSGFIVFYANRDRVEQEIEEEKRDQMETEQKRYSQFPDRFPRINKMPGLSHIGKWIYKEGLWNILALLFIITLNVVLTTHQWIEIKGFWIDEWISIKTAGVYFSGNFPYLPSGNPISYGYLYLFLLNLVHQIIPTFNSGRILNIIFFIFFCFIYYNLVKTLFKHGSLVLLSLFILSISPFLIYINNEVRGYAFSLLLCYGILYVFFININIKLKITTLFILSIVFLDNHITNILILVILFALSFIEVTINKNYRKYFPLVGLSGFILFTLAILAYKGNFIDAIFFYYNKLIGGSMPDWASYKVGFWYPFSYLMNNAANSVIILLGVIGSMVVIFKHKTIKYLLTFLIIFLIPVGLQKIPDGFRYFFTILPIFLLILSLGIYYGLRTFENKILRTVVYTLLFTLGIYSIFYPLITDIPWAKTLDFKEVANVISPYIKSDTIIMTNYDGIQISDYLSKIDYIIFDKAVYIYNQNLQTFGKTNMFGSKYNGKPGSHFLLDITYISVSDLRTLIENNDIKNVIIIIRPWKSDLDGTTYNTIENIGFRNLSSDTAPFDFFVYEK